MNRCKKIKRKNMFIEYVLNKTYKHIRWGEVKLKTFFGGVFIKKESLEEAQINHPIKLEYYKRINEDEIVENKNAKYGISIVKTEYIQNNTKTESKELKYLSNDENKIEKVLNILKENEVTPIGVEDVISDLKSLLF